MYTCLDRTTILLQAVACRVKDPGHEKLATSAYPNGDDGVERVNHTMAQMLAMVVNERRDNWDVRLPHVEFDYNICVSAATAVGTK